MYSTRLEYMGAHAATQVLQVCLVLAAIKCTPLSESNGRRHLILC